MKNKKYNTIETVPKSKLQKSQKEANSIYLAHKYMTTHFLDSVQTLQ